MPVNATASAISIVLLFVAGCSILGPDIPGETLTSRAQKRAIRDRVLELSQEARPDCRRRELTETEVLDLHPDGKVAVERWTVTQCGERARYIVTLPPTGRGTGFVVKPETRP